MHVHTPYLATETWATKTPAQGLFAAQHGGSVLTRTAIHNSSTKRYQIDTSMSRARVIGMASLCAQLSLTKETCVTQDNAIFLQRHLHNCLHNCGTALLHTKQLLPCNCSAGTEKPGQRSDRRRAAAVDQWRKIHRDAEATRTIWSQGAWCGAAEVEQQRRGA